jgi:hypothetical protein
MEAEYSYETLVLIYKNTRQIPILTPSICVVSLMKNFIPIQGNI